MIIVTGVSRGLGKAIAEHYLRNGQYVMGIGRSHDIVHSNFSFQKCDLSDLDQVKSMKFNVLTGAVTLINNAGIIGEIDRISDQRELDIDEVLTVNVSAVAILTNKVYNNSLDKNKFSLVNISSGAAKRAIPSWAAYCASKAALNMYTETFYREELEKGFTPNVYAVAPGVVDTGMQKEIRSVSPQSFSAHENFVRMKNENELFSAEEAASRLAKLLEMEYSGEVNSDLRDIA